MAINDNSPLSTANPSLLCVLGMHRSGTSVVTRFLHLCGAHVAPDLLSAMHGVNQEGFWEDRGVVDINESLLSAKHSRWYSFDQGAADQNLELMRSAAVNHFAQNYSKQMLSVVKDPRLCRLLPFWLEVWAATKINPCFVHVVRHPYAVAKSLQRRDRIPYEYGVVLWLLHTVEALVCSRTHAGLIIDYDAFLQRPLDLVDKLVSRLSVVGCGAQDDWRAAAQQAINGDLRHNDHSIDSSLGLSEICTFSLSLYAAISARTLDVMEPLVLDQYRVELQRLLARYENEIAMLERLCVELMGLSAESVRIGELHSVALAVIHDKDEIIANQSAVISDQGVAINEKNTVIADQSAIIVGREKLIASHEQIIADQHGIVMSQQKIIADHAQFFSDFLHLRFWRVIPRVWRKVIK